MTVLDKYRELRHGRHGGFDPPWSSIAAILSGTGIIGSVRDEAAREAHSLSDKLLNRSGGTSAVFERSCYSTECRSAFLSTLPTDVSGILSMRSMIFGTL